jgi:hypothetical protein
MYFWIILVLMDLSANDDVPELQQGSGNECGQCGVISTHHLTVTFC